MTSKEMLAFANYVREHVGFSDLNEAPLLGLLDGYGLSGAERDDMLWELHKIGAVSSVHIDSPLQVDKLPQS